MTVFIMRSCYFRDATRLMLDHYDEYKAAVWNSYAGKPLFESLNRCEANDLTGRIAYARALMARAGYQDVDAAVEYFNGHANILRDHVAVVEEALARRVQ